MTSSYTNALHELEDSVHSIISLHQHQQMIIVDYHNSDDHTTTEQTALSSSSSSSSTSMTASQYNKHYHHQQQNQQQRRHSHHRIKRRKNRQCNTYERKRALRRLQRALLSFEEVMVQNNKNSSSNDDEYCDDFEIGHEFERNENDENDDDHDAIDSHPSSSSPILLDDSSLKILFDILTEIPKGWSSSFESASPTTKTSSNHELDHQYNQDILPITCCIIERFAILPLNPILIDKLLDRIAMILSKYRHHEDERDGDGGVGVGRNASEIGCFLNMIQIINTSLLAQDQKIQQQEEGVEEEKDQEQQEHFHQKNDENHDHEEEDDDFDHHHHGIDHITHQFDNVEEEEEEDPAVTTQPPSSQSSLLLLDANETIALTQLLIPLSLKHLSNEWEFIIPTTKSTTSSKKHEIITIHDDDDDEKNDDENNEGIINDDQEEDPNHNHHNDYSDDVDNDEECHKHMKDVQQESEVQLRVLLGYLFRHLSSLIQNHSQKQSNCNGQSSIFTSKSSLEEILLLLFRNDQIDSSNSSGSSIDDNQRMIVEDYIDLISSYLTESIEYAIDVVDTATHFLSHGLNAQMKTTHDVNSVSVVRRYVKDTVRHCSIVIGMIEIFYEDDVGYKTFRSGTKPSSSSTSASTLPMINNSHLTSFFKSFAEFVGEFCNDGLLHGELCVSGSGGSSSEDIEMVNVLFHSADNVLLRLYRIIYNCNLAGNDTIPSQGGGNVDVMKIAGGKRRRKGSISHVDPNRRSNYPFMDMASMICFLRSIHRLNQSTCNNEEYEAAELVIHTSTTRTLSMDSLLDNTRYALSNEDTNMIQACALSTVLSSDQMSRESEDSPEEELTKESLRNEVLLASLLSPLVSNCDKDKKEIRSTNPWGFLLGNKLLDMNSQLNVSGNHHVDENGNCVSSSPPVAVSTSSLSSVSDLKSNFASLSSANKTNPTVGVTSSKAFKPADPNQIVSDFARSIPECFKTIC